MSDVIARAVYQDRRDPATYEYRIEERHEGYALIHGLAGRDDLETEEFFQWEYELRSMLPQPHAETPTSNLAVESLLAQWSSATDITKFDRDEARRRIADWVRRPQPTDEPG